MTKFEIAGILPDYVNNARIEVTEDNVFIDFGFADPFENKGKKNALSTPCARVVMSISTFKQFAKHTAKLEKQLAANATDIPVSILSRCPPSSSSTSSPRK